MNPKPEAVGKGKDQRSQDAPTFRGVTLVPVTRQGGSPSHKHVADKGPESCICYALGIFGYSDQKRRFKKEKSVHGGVQPRRLKGRTVRGGWEARCTPAPSVTAA